MRHGDMVALKELVLLGGGHSHVGVLKGFGIRPMAGVRVTVICPDIRTPYSGMLPGFIAGHYRLDQIHIDLRQLCRFAGAQLCRAEAVGIDLRARRVLLSDGPPVQYDLLSINTGAVPDVRQVPGAADHVIPLKPIPEFLKHWPALQERAIAQSGQLRVGMVGAGAAGVETLLAVQYALRRLLRELDPHTERLQYFLFCDTPQILPTHSARVRRAFERILARRRIEVLTGRPVTAIGPGRLTVAGAGEFPLDSILWATGACAPAWFAHTGLALDERGFIRVDDALRSVSHPEIYAAGDAAALAENPRPKAGVFAVRAAKPLERNLRRVLLGSAPMPFRPQRSFLSLISTGNRCAVASRNGWMLRGRLMWRWKDWIDRSFVRAFTELPSGQSQEPRVVQSSGADLPHQFPPRKMRDETDDHNRGAEADPQQQVALPGDGGPAAHDLGDVHRDRTGIDVK